MRAERARDAERRGGRRGHRRHDGERPPSIRWTRSPSAARRTARGCTSTPPTPGRRWSAPSIAGRSPASQRGGLARRQRAQVDAHADGLLAALVRAARGPAAGVQPRPGVPAHARTPRTPCRSSSTVPALGRRFRALKLWAVLRCHGRAGLQAHIRSGVAARGASSSSGWRAEPELGALRAAALLGRLLPPAADRTSATPSCCERVNGRRRVVHLPRGARRPLRPAARRRAMAHDGRRRAPRLGDPAARGGTAVISAAEALALVDTIPGWMRPGDAEVLYRLAAETRGPIRRSAPTAASPRC